MLQAAFTERLVRANRLDGLKRWVFCPGMLFNASRKWWGDGRYRKRPHEGVDLLLFRDIRGRMAYLDTDSLIPVMFDGVVVTIIDDFLGKTVMVEHSLSDGDTGKVLTIYGHTKPLGELHPGGILKQGDIVGRLAGCAGPDSGMRPHLHVSIVKVEGEVWYDRLDWNNIYDSEALTLINPLHFIGGEYEILDETDRPCSIDTG